MMVHAMKLIQKFTSNALMAAMLVLLALCGTSVYGQNTSPPHGKTAAIPAKTPDGTWDSLSPAQQKILEPLESDWDYMLPDSRKKMDLCFKHISKNDCHRSRATSITHDQLV